MFTLTVIPSCVLIYWQTAWPCTDQAKPLSQGGLGCADFKFTTSFQFTQIGYSYYNTPAIIIVTALYCFTERARVHLLFILFALVTVFPRAGGIVTIFGGGNQGH